MSSSGLSLVGFLDQAQAIEHLTKPCVPNPPNKSQADLVKDWQVAQVKLGPAIANAGCPDIQDIPLRHPYIQMLVTSSHWAQALQAAIAKGLTFKNVEIDPLLAFQLNVDTDRSTHHCGHMSNPPTEAELQAVCLPVAAPRDDYHISKQDQSIIIRCRSLNLRIQHQGAMPNLSNMLGIYFNWNLPLVHVVRYQGKCYLHNGFHRAYGVRIAGATHVPCMFRDVAAPEEVGAGNGHFELPMLQTTNPPTVNHFTGGRAFDVKLRTATRIIQVNWSEHTMYEE